MFARGNKAKKLNFIKRKYRQVESEGKVVLDGCNVTSSRNQCDGSLMKNVNDKVMNHTANTNREPVLFDSNVETCKNVCDTRCKE